MRTNYYRWQGLVCDWLVFPSLNKAIPILGINLNLDAYARFLEEESIKTDMARALATINTTTIT